jgi:pyruvate kinase
MVDLKGPLIRTLGFKNMYSVKVASGQEIRLSTNQNILGDEGMFVIDYDNIHEHLRLGDKILVDYGGVVLTVIGFEPEEKYLK